MQDSILSSSLFTLYIKGDHIKLVKDKEQVRVEIGGGKVGDRREIQLHLVLH